MCFQRWGCICIKAKEASFKFIMINYNDLKLLSKKELMDLVPEGFSFKTDPWEHQLAAFLATIANNGFNEWLDLGTGKTKVAIDVMSYFEQFLLGQPLRCLFICLNTAVDKIGEEIEAHCDHSWVKLKGSVDKKFSLLNGHGYFVANYEALRVMLTKRVPKANRRGNREVLDEGKIQRLLKFGFNGLVIDEAHKIKNPSSLNFRIVKKLVPRINQRLLLTGTPFGKNLLDVWAQYYAADKGETFGKAWTHFRTQYGEEKPVYAYGMQVSSKWEVTDEGREQIAAKMFDKAIRYDEDEVKGLPKKVYRMLRFNLSRGQAQAYEEAIMKVGKFKQLDNATMVHRQIPSGIIVSTDYIFKQNPKLDMLKDLLDSVVDRHKVVVFHEFILEGQIIAKALKGMKIKFSQLNGQVRDKTGSIRKFQRKDDCRVMVAHPLSGGSSIDLNIARYCVFFSNNRDPIERRQCEKRIHRGRIKHRRFFYDLIAQNTIEVGLYKSLKDNKDLFNSIMDKRMLIDVLRGK